MDVPRLRRFFYGFQEESWLLRHGGDLFEEGLFGEEAHVGGFRLTVLEEVERGDGLNIVLSGEGAFFVDVDFQDSEFAVLFGGDFVEQGGEHFAGATPWGPEIDDDGAA